MTILGIETSCDETAAAIVQDGTQILSNVVASSQDIQKKYGGIVPEVAARKQVEYMIPVLTEAFQKAGLDSDEIDAIAVTIGPGLIGSLLVGVETAKTLSYVWHKPLIPVNHLIGHIYSAWLDDLQTGPPRFPILALIVSGGHTELILLHGHDKLEKIGQTLDDAAGEAFDKVARILNLNYPGGPEIEKLAEKGNPSKFNFPRPLIQQKNFDFSFSGLKTAVLYAVQKISSLDQPTQADMAASFQQAVIDVLVHKTITAAKHLQVNSILVTGGVAANQALKKQFQLQVVSELPAASLHIPPLGLATDNAAYIAAAGYFLNPQLKPDLDLTTILDLQPNPSLEIVAKPHVPR